MTTHVYKRGRETELNDSSPEGVEFWYLQTQSWLNSPECLETPDVDLIFVDGEAPAGDNAANNFWTEQVKAAFAGRFSAPAGHVRVLDSDCNWRTAPTTKITVAPETWAWLADVDNHMQAQPLTELSAKRGEITVLLNDPRVVKGLRGYGCRVSEVTDGDSEASLNHCRIYRVLYSPELHAKRQKRLQNRPPAVRSLTVSELHDGANALNDLLCEPGLKDYLSSNAWSISRNAVYSYLLGRLKLMILCYGPTACLTKSKFVTFLQDYKKARLQTRKAYLGGRDRKDVLFDYLDWLLKQKLPRKPSKGKNRKPPKFRLPRREAKLLFD